MINNAQVIGNPPLLNVTWKILGWNLVGHPVISEGFKAISGNAVSCLDFFEVTGPSCVHLSEATITESVVVFQWSLFHLVRLGYFTKYKFMWMSDRSTNAFMVKLRSYNHYYPNQKILFNLIDQTKHAQAGYPGLFQLLVISGIAGQNVSLVYAAAAWYYSIDQITDGDGLGGRYLI
jgi:hypothetical protein